MFPTYPLAIVPPPPYIDAEDVDPAPKKRYGMGTKTYIKAADGN